MYKRRSLLIVCLFFLLPALLAASEKQTVCLNMIVKDESPVIKRCLESTKPYIDYWVIVDTGSTDGTQAIIKEMLKDIPGELYERPWVNFGHNRDEALQLAKGKADYLMFIDADEYLVPDLAFHFPKLTYDVYLFRNYYEGISFTRFHLAKSHPSLRWEGVIHEYLVTPEQSTFAILAGLSNFSTTEGARSRDPAKFLKDAMTLENELKKDPNNPRHVFYLAQSYRCFGNKEEALKNYLRRAEMGECSKRFTNRSIR